MQLLLLSLLPALAQSSPLSSRQSSPRSSSVSVVGRSQSSQERADAVREGFEFAWNGYYEYAFPHDELHPVSNGFGDSRNGWGASAVDALSTAIIMQLPNVTNQILDHIAEIDYSQSSDVVSLFETTIRYLAGMLSGYDLLTGPFQGLISDQSKIDVLLKQSKALADQMKFAFNTITGIPYNGLFVGNQSVDGEPTNGLAGAGSLVIEWTHLSDLTGDQEYAELAQKAESWLLDPSSEVWPGLLGSNIDIENGTFLDSDVTWDGGDDSFYEYLIKMFVYDSDKFSKYKDRWVAAAESTIEHLASHPSTRSDLTFLASYDGTSLQYGTGHLACFDGGNFILGGEVLNRQDLIDFGLNLVDSCHETYSQTVTGIGPGSWNWDVNGTSDVPDDQADFYQHAGFWINDSSYDLRPEVIESFYYAYRSTKDSKYQDWAWDAFVSINETTRTDSGYSDIDDVNTSGGGDKGDLQESFLFAEVMKYSYLIHAEDAEYQVLHDGKNGWVLNTEAHPFKVQGTSV